jgi:Tfp pilus assembly protein PilO
LRVPKRLQKRNRALVALLLPAIIFLWIVGWSLYWIGHQQERKQKPQHTRLKENVHLVPVLLEEPEEMAS